MRDDAFDLYDAMVVLNARHKARVASSSAVAAFEQARSLRLPAGFRYLATELGAGKMAEYCHFYVPLGRKNAYDLDTFDRACHEDAETWGEHVPAGAFPHVLFFASTVGGELFGWRTDQARKAGRGVEYHIYHFKPRGPAKLVAKSFPRFILACLEGELGGPPGYLYEKH